jgi:hypothetical protein
MIAQRLRNMTFVAGLALLSGCGVTQSQVDAQLNQRMSEMHSYVDQKVAASEADTHKNIAELKAASEAVRETAEAVLKVMQSQEADVRRNRETLSNLLEAQSQALDQEKRAVDALLERLKAGTPMTSAPAAPTPGPTTPMPTSPKTP